MKDDECIEKVTITVFPPMSGIGIVEADPVVEDEDACGDSSTSGVSVDVSKSDTVNSLLHGLEYNISNY